MNTAKYDPVVYGVLKVASALNSASATVSRRISESSSNFVSVRNVVVLIVVATSSTLFADLIITVRNPLIIVT